MASADSLPTPLVTPLHDLPPAAAEQLLARLGLQLVWVAAGAEIPGTYWGESEAGLIGSAVYVRPDTPAHSLLHETSHAICAGEHRRAALHTNAGGSDTEEHAVCYLQCLLADALHGYSRARCFADMDAWGYHFILGSAQAWFERDAEDAQQWLRQRGLMNERNQLLMR